MKAKIDETIYQHITDELTYKFTGVFSPESVAEAVAAARAELEPTATVLDYLPVPTAGSPRSGSPPQPRSKAGSPNKSPSCCSSASTTPVAPSSPPHWPTTWPRVGSMSAPPDPSRPTTEMRS